MSRDAALDIVKRYVFETLKPEDHETVGEVTNGAPRFVIMALEKVLLSQKISKLRELIEELENAG